MPRATWRWILVTAVVVLMLTIWIATTSRHDVALIRVVNASGAPVADAVILPEGLRTKPGPYAGGWYGWQTNMVPNPPVHTDHHGHAQVPYPKYVFERIETGTLCLRVDHPDYVPDRPERIVATAPPAGAPWRVRLEDLVNRVLGRSLFAEPDPIVLHVGATLRLSVRQDSVPDSARLFAQVSGMSSVDSNFWIQPEPGVILTRRLAAGPRSVRLIQIDSEGVPWFSDVTPFTAIAGQTHELALALKRGVTVRGQLDNSVPRPVGNGRVVAHVWPQGVKPRDDPPQWHAWAAVRADGTFTFNSLPEGDLELVALCHGFVSTNGPGQFQLRYPQRHVLGTNDLDLTIGMEPTARLHVQVNDDKGRALNDVRVLTWPNVRYGEWAATILMSDCFNTTEILLAGPACRDFWGQTVPDVQAVSDRSGLAIISNLPASVSELSVEHPHFALPVVREAEGRQRRVAKFALIAGHTNHLSIQLEPRERSKISHY